VLFSVHMIQHMALNMVVPILGVLGAPITLALRTLPTTSSRGGTPPRQALLGLLHSWPVRLVTHPLVASALFVFSLYGLYFSGLFEASMRNHWGHLAMQAHFLASGGLFFWVLVGIDPTPRRLPHAARLPLLFVVMVFHAFFGVVLLSGTSIIGESYFAALHRSWGRSLLEDQQFGGGIAWSLGEPVTLLVILIVVLQWLRADEREARRFDRAADRAENRAAARAAAPPSAEPPEDPVDDELAAYNARLLALHQRAEGRRRG
jgi:cytochrome c oxidase assembly factor CtaG